MENITTFKLGDINCHVLSDNNRQGPMDLNKMFPTAPADELKQVLADYKVDPENITISFNCVCLEMADQKILIDTGVGVEHEGKFIGLLEEVNIKLDEIDHVIFTHGHADHIGGITDADSNLLFKNAKYWMSKAEWDFWENDSNLLKEPQHAVAGAEKNLPLIADNINLIEEEGEILPGIQIIHIPGHTVGMMAIEIVSNGEKLLICADFCLRPFQIEHPEWNSISDRLPELAPGSRRKILKRAVDHNALVLAYHFPHPGLGRVTPQGDTWIWEAAEI
jgi:glyoxylase-like metal-dependent hydrolase (beta-lactamase superfamily II)